MNTSTQFYLLARSWMQLARKRKRRGDTVNACALVRAARDAVRDGRIWQHVLEQPPREPWEAQRAMIARIQPYQKRIDVVL